MAGDNRLISKPEDRRILEKLTVSLSAPAGQMRPAGDLAIAVGRFLLGSPYAAGTLEQKGAERLVVNLRQFDCFTLVENAAVLARLLGAGKTGFADYTAALARLRYRGGRLHGYAARLHYFSDWLRDNQKKKLLQDVTRVLGGVPFSRPISFMTANPRLYPPLKDPRVFREMQAVEQRCSCRRLYHIPQRELRGREDGILDGDLIGITTDREGLDVAHAGLAVRVKGRIHLLHASRAAGRVILASETLVRYLAADKARTGIMVGRIK